MTDPSHDGQEVLFRAFYEELHRVAVRMMRRLKPGHTLQPSALVHETLLRLMSDGMIPSAIEKQKQYAMAVRAMRSVLIDHYRFRKTAKRGGNWVRHPLDDVLDHFEKHERFPFSDLHESIDELAALEPRQALVVTFRYFLGMSSPEVAEVLGVSLSTVESDWRLARAWLRSRLNDGRSQ